MHPHGMGSLLQELDAKTRVKRMENLLQLTMPGMMGERFRVLEAWK